MKRFHPVHERQERAAKWSLLRDVVLPGAVVGTLGALAMTALALPLGALTRGDVWYAARLAGGVFFREAPAGPWAVVLGLLVHVSTAGGLATLFALLLPRGGTATAALFLGLLMALGLQAVMPELVAPWASPPLDRASPRAALLLLHLAFGASLGLMVPVRRGLAAVDRARRAVQAVRAPLG
ncbi:hypothetical protein [Corallococcus macrosporus]|uniref:Uncharacterized protein n=1 Tax=Corallococcus macrosporus DSM 14697 TaxID=1189310 RepID=A0A250JYQ3_9BACT|nr:hypothetical protein [Corallococcus macrosporus]ATB48602.1 hypothetical protein MYMAC_004229 [Corallococcus macrosporus DSM 14697]